VRRLLRLYPRSWRERYGDEFDALLADSRGGPRLLLDVARAAFDERIRRGDLEMRRLLPWALLAISEVVIGWMNFHAADDVQPVAAALLLAGFGFGYYRPRQAWLFAGLLWLAIPISGIYADAVNYHPGQLKPAPLYTTLIALIPALLGAYGGAAARWVLRFPTGSGGRAG
jgi:hypothetical protein